ncbi:MAG: hypothetical protein M1836_001993 [Candelina mexicana]|nr:MAG: hypothetical protein M1836_001993 [Candelina mexicana]
MAGMEDLEVVGCVAAIVSIYNQGVKALEANQKQHYLEGPAQDQEADDRGLEKLKGSLKLGSTAVQDEYDKSFKRLGRSIATGDQIARNALRDIIFELEQSLLKPLQSVSKQDIAAFTALRTTSDQCRATVVTVLEKLHQRLLMAAKIWSLPDPHITSDAFVFPTSNGRRSFESFYTNSTENSVPYGNMTFVTTSRPTPPKTSTQGLLAFIKNNGFRRSKGQDHLPKSLQQSSAASSKRTLVPKLPAITVGKTNGSWFEQNNDTKDNTAFTTLKTHRIARSRSKSIAGVDFIKTFDQNIWLKPWEAVHSQPSPPSPPSDTSSETSRLKQFTSCTREIFFVPIKRPTTSTFSTISDPAPPAEPKPGPTEHWPSPANNYSGFCKGAYKLQQDIPGAMRLSFRPVGSYTYSEFWKCQKCLFEGAVHGTEKKRGFDTRVHEAGNGLLYRWVFLAKSHAFKGRYGGRGSGDVEWFKCIFCAAEGEREEEAFAGKEQLMQHLKEVHAETRPREEVLERTRCVFGRRAGEGEYFELCIPSGDVEAEIKGGQVEAEVVDTQIPDDERETPRIVNRQEMKAEILASQRTTSPTAHSHNLTPQEPIAQLIPPNENTERQELDVKVTGTDAQLEAVQLVTGQLQKLRSDDFQDLFEHATVVDGD